MAILFNFEDKDEAFKKEYKDWYESRPKIIRDLIDKLPPNKLYKMKHTNQRVTILSYNENGTVMVTVSGVYNLVTFDRNVFGVNPNDLEECDLPKDNELLGTLLF